ncbi:uncharacterized protein SETTUDRAFT_24225 [Exserohilum turcica Et28A]|uniref:Uncharacterized protein n=1 Tax=Exserohilum turcicum (strain 28A) TaxID=671987 RepID=R0JT58_EXST2|nr:uncharacterized protein SETTUDRAFT_24225 [Exserohilum turcica Et28A]EOA80709.1 hypothetical protein SETTUDRAFT_24225 [Exserohilum turcica Et28A]
MNSWYTDSQYTELASHCVEAPFDELPVIHDCDTIKLQWTYNNHSLYLGQDLPNGKTVFGYAEWPRGQLEGTINATKIVDTN